MNLAFEGQTRIQLGIMSSNGVSPGTEYVNFFGKDDKPKDKSADDSGDAHAREEDATPSILLEQLAYVDNFFPSLDHDFAADSWMVHDYNGAAGGSGVDGAMSVADMGLDEQLSAELSVFADDAFIFPDEDKSNRNNNNSGDDGDDESNNNNSNTNNNNNNNINNNIINNINNNSNSNENDRLDEDDEISLDGGSGRRQRNPHFLTQRRNNFLMSQYDQARGRFSANRRKENNNNNQNPFGDEPTSPVRRSSDDHGEFTNVNIGTSPNNDMDPQHSPPQDNDPYMRGMRSNTGDSPRDTQNPANLVRNHRPSISSPLNNVIANSSQWNSGNHHTPAVSSRQFTQAQTAPTANQHTDIELPDYSAIPTSTLVSLLPRVKVPPGAYNTLLGLGFTSDQIDAMSALIAYNEQQKKKTGQLIDHNNISNEESLKTLLDLFNKGHIISKKPQSVNTSGNDELNNYNDHGGISSQSQSPQPAKNRPNKKNNIKINEKALEKQEADSAEFLESILRMHSSQQTNKIRKPQSSDDTNHMETISRTKSDTQVHADSEQENKEYKELTRTHSINNNLNRDTSQHKRIRSSSISDSQENASDAPAKKRSIDHKQESSKSQENSKRKVKEKELETSIQELSELAVTLQQKIHTLEMENKLLKNLVLSSGDLNMAGLDNSFESESISKSPKMDPKVAKVKR